MHYYRSVMDTPFHKDNFILTIDEPESDLYTITGSLISLQQDISEVKLTKVYPNFLANRIFRNIKNQDLYEFLMITNLDCDDINKWPLMAVYANVKSGKVYSRPFVEFLDKFNFEKFVRG